VKAVSGINPVDYLADILLRIQTHTASRIDELLPHSNSRPTEDVSRGSSRAGASRFDATLTVSPAAPGGPA